LDESIWLVATDLKFETVQGRRMWQKRKRFPKKYSDNWVNLNPVSKQNFNAAGAAGGAGAPVRPQ
jgi:hypothetical protein